MKRRQVQGHGHGWIEDQDPELSVPGDTLCQLVGIHPYSLLLTGALSAMELRAQGQSQGKGIQSKSLPVTYGDRPFPLT